MFNLKLLGASVVGASIIGFGAGWVVHGWKHSADNERALKRQAEAHNKALAHLQTDLDNEASERLRLSEALNDALTNVRTVTKETIREVPLYVPPSTDECPRILDPNLVRLLNSAARGIAPRSNSKETTTRDLSDSLPALAGYPSDE